MVCTCQFTISDAPVDRSSGVLSNQWPHAWCIGCRPNSCKHTPCLHHRHLASEGCWTAALRLMLLHSAAGMCVLLACSVPATCEQPHQTLTCASCAWVSFLAVLAAVICFFNSVETFSSAAHHMQCRLASKIGLHPLGCRSPATAVLLLPSQRGSHSRWKSSVSASSL